MVKAKNCVRFIRYPTEDIIAFIPSFEGKIRREEVDEVREREKNFQICVLVRLMTRKLSGLFKKLQVKRLKKNKRKIR